MLRMSRQPEGRRLHQLRPPRVLHVMCVADERMPHLSAEVWARAGLQVAKLPGGSCHGAIRISCFKHGSDIYDKTCPTISS